MPICEYCQKDEESHMCPEFVNKLRRDRDDAVRALEVIVSLGPVDPATNAAKIGLDAMGVAVTALNKRKQPKCRWCAKGWAIKEVRHMHEAPDTGELARCEGR